MMLPLALALLQVGPVLDDVPYGLLAPGQPGYEETVLDIVYPSGTGPLSLGYPAAPGPLVVYLRGGNENKPLDAPANVDGPVPAAFLAHGFTYVEPSYHVLDTQAGEPFLNATRDAARAVQFLRTHATALNLDPQRLLVIGRSAGGYHAYALGLGQDFQEPSSGDVVLHASSRPDAIVSWGGPADLACVHPQAPYLPLFFEGKPNEQITAQEKLEQSPTWWLAHPEVFQRASTPYVGVVANLASVSPCGLAIDPHDGIHGLRMHEAVAAYDATLGPAGDLAEEALLLDGGIGASEATAGQLAQWAETLPILQPPGTWTDLGHGLAGTHGVPQLAGAGELHAGTPWDVTLAGALEGAAAFLVVGFAALDAPFRGGLLVPDPGPPGFIVPLACDGAGALWLHGEWPATLPSGGSLVLAQFWVVDPAGPQGLSASNALAADVP